MCARKDGALVRHMDSLFWDRLGDTAFLLSGLREASDGRRCRAHAADTLLLDCDGAVLPSPGGPAGEGSGLWIGSNGEGEVVSRVGAPAPLLRRFCERVLASAKDARSSVR